MLYRETICAECENITRHNYISRVCLTVLEQVLLPTITYSLEYETLNETMIVRRMICLLSLWTEVAAYFKVE